MIADRPHIFDNLFFVGIFPWRVRNFYILSRHLPYFRDVPWFASAGSV